MVVCFEVDAYVATADNTLESSDQTTATVQTASSEDIRVFHRGRRVPQANLVEIKTNKTVRWRETVTYPQIFLAQTPHLFTTRHERGNFHQIHKRHIDDPFMRQVADECNGDMTRLCDALLVVRDALLRHREQGRASLLCRRGQLDLYRMENAQSCLPDAVLRSSRRVYAHHSRELPVYTLYNVSTQPEFALATLRLDMNISLRMGSRRRCRNSAGSSWRG